MAAHRYWRLLFTACPQGTNVSAASIRLLETQNGPNLATDVAAASSSTTDTRGPYTPSAGIAGQPSFWSAADASGMPQWWAYDFGAGSPRDISSAGFTARTDNSTAAGYYTATAFDVQWSDNGADWTTAWHVDTPQWGSGETRTFAEPIAGRHRFWRINTTACADGNYVSFQQVGMATAPGGPNLLGSGTAIASSSYDNGHAPSQAARPETGFPWIAAGGPPAWWGYDFGAGNPVSVGSVIISCDPGAASRAPGTWTLDYSDNGTDWTPSLPVSSGVWVGGTPQSFTPAPAAAYVTPPPGKHRYWRLNIRQSGTASRVSASLIKLAEADGVNRATAPASASSSPVYSGGTGPSICITGQPTGEGWLLYDTTSGYWEYDFGYNTYYDIQNVYIESSERQYSSNPIAFDVQWSDTNNGTDWTTAWSVNNAPVNTASHQSQSYADPALTSRPPSIAPGQHRFWRVNILQNYGGPYTGFATVTLAESDGVNRATDPNGAAASSAYPGQEARCAIAGVGPDWATASLATSGWWSYDFGAGNGFQVAAVSFTAQSGASRPAFLPQHFAVQWSDTGNGTDWRTAWEIADARAAPTDNETRSYVPPPPIPPAAAQHIPIASGFGAHRFWRIFVSNTVYYNTSTYANVTIAEIALAASAAGPNLIGHGVASSPYSDNAASAVDGDPATAWSCSGGVPKTWVYDFGAGNAFDIRYVTMLPPSDDPRKAPDTWTLDWSDNGADWTVGPAVKSAAWSPGVAQPFSFDAPSSDPGQGTSATGGQAKAYGFVMS